MQIDIVYYMYSRAPPAERHHVPPGVQRALAALVDDLERVLPVAAGLQRCSSLLAYCIVVVVCCCCCRCLFACMCGCFV